MVRTDLPEALARAGRKALPKDSPQVRGEANCKAPTQNERTRPLGFGLDTDHALF